MVQQPVVQFRTAIHGNGLSGSALNCFQKLVHVRKTLSIRGKMAKNSCSVRILANRAAPTPVAPVTSRKLLQRFNIALSIALLDSYRVRHLESQNPCSSRNHRS